jgi:hypothetical protein
LNGDALVQRPEPTLPKPGVRGSSPLRDAILHAISDVLKCTGMNSRATGRRIHGLRKRFGREERSRGYRAVTSSNDSSANGGSPDLSGISAERTTQRKTAMRPHPNLTLEACSDGRSQTRSDTPKTLVRRAFAKQDPNSQSLPAALPRPVCRLNVGLSL